MKGWHTNVNNVVSTLPDKLLRFSQYLPLPAKSRMWDKLKQRSQQRGRATGELTRISFGDVVITAPLDHPAVYWRYFPGFNQNYLQIVKLVLQARNGLIIDVGANIGDGVALLRGAGVNAPILAVEGADIWFTLLRKNTGIFSDVLLEQVFLGSGFQVNSFELHVQDGTSKLVKGTSGIEITSLDLLLLRHAVHPVVLLKTDTDGFDAKVLLGARSVLTKQRPVVFAEIDEGLLRDQGNSAQELLIYLSECGYLRIAVWDNYGRWLGSRPLSLGIADLIASYPGGPDLPYLDVAVFAQENLDVLDALEGSVINGN